MRKIRVISLPAEAGRFFFFKIYRNCRKNTLKPLSFFRFTRIILEKKGFSTRQEIPYGFGG